MSLAKIAGVDVASVKLTQTANKDVLLAERFDVENRQTEKHHFACYHPHVDYSN
jgi:hypothetical protein